MRAVIFAGGSIREYDYIKSYLKDDDLIIAADSGFDHVLRLGITPDVFVGDMDSVKSEVVAKEIIKLEVMKDETDTEAAAMLAMDRGAKDILLLAATGTRLDHTLANILLLKKLYDNGVTATIVDEKNEIHFFKNKIKLFGNKDETVSVIPLSQMKGVTTSGLLYKLTDGELEYASSRGVSNVMTGNSCTITAAEGEALVIKSRD